MTVTLDDIVEQYFISETQNIPDDTVKQTFIRTVRTFCFRTKAWRQEIECLALADIPQIQVSVPSQAELIHCFSIYFPQKHKSYRNPKVVDKTGIIIIKNFPRLENSMFGISVCAYQPKISATSIDSDFFTQWFDYLRHGTLYNLRQMYGREWFEPNIAIQHMQLFEDGIAKAVHDVQDDYRVAPDKAKSEWI